MMMELSQVLCIGNLISKLKPQLLGASPSTCIDALSYNFTVSAVVYASYSLRMKGEAIKENVVHESTETRS